MITSDFNDYNASYVQNHVFITYDIIRFVYCNALYLENQAFMEEPVILSKVMKIYLRVNLF